LLEAELTAQLEPEQARLTARRQAMAYARHFGGEALYVPQARESERRQRDQAIREARRNGAKVRDLARAHRISRSRVHAILSG
jgi:Mor family transcriptional regulator